MSFRSVIFGLLLGVGIAGFTYFNDFVIRQTMFVGNFFPISVLGPMVVVLLAVNPLLRLLGPGWPLRASEVAVIVALALAACGWAGSNFARYVPTLPSMSSHWQRTSPTWQAHAVFSYVPGGSATVAPGQVTDWAELARRIVAGEQAVARRLWSQMDAPDRRRFELAAEAVRLDPDQPPPLAAALNRVLAEPGLFDDQQMAALDLSATGRSLLERSRETDLDARHRLRLHRAVLVAAWPELVLPPPRGSPGVLLQGGQPDPEVLDPLVTGLHTERVLPVDRVPWGAWWPTIRLWWGIALLLGLASLCMALVVHPQWSSRELLPYPIARFVEEASQRQVGRWLPDVAASRLFWLGGGALFTLHLVNGLHVWFDQAPQIQLGFNFNPLRELFPTASRVVFSNAYFAPHLYLSVVAFSFFINRSVALSLGVAQLLFMVFGTVLLSYGLPIEYDKFQVNKTNLLRTGSYLGVALMVLYTGRRYYLDVAKATLGLARERTTPGYAVWAARALALTVGLAIGGLVSAGLEWWLAALLVGLCLVIWLVMARIVAETGTFFLSGPVLPLGVLPGLLGDEAIGPTGLLLLGLAGSVLLIDPREAVMPYLSTGLRMAEGTGNRVRSVTPWLAVMVGVALLVAGGVALTVAYEQGTSIMDNYASQHVPNHAFHQLASRSSEMLTQQTLAKSTAAAGLAERWAMIRPTPGSLGWLALGVALVTGFAVARLRWPWWPLHPVIFLVWGTWAMAHFTASFLLGWAIKAAVINLAGLRGYQACRPLVIGVIAGELAGGLLWVIVGTAYYFITGQTPERYAIFPGV
ncbi:MAG: DUF6785 family protein [Phycisphaeraceae bacterium]